MVSPQAVGYENGTNINTQLNKYISRKEKSYASIHKYICKYLQFSNAFTEVFAEQHRHTNILTSLA